MSWNTFLKGPELPTAQSSHQVISRVVALAVFASDSLSSVAYAGGEILLMLAILGSSGYWLAMPITAAICVLLAILTFSYQQTIHAYPSGGGAYIVAKDNFGDRVAQIAGASLLIDYILTVAVSIASGVDQVASMFPILFAYKVQIALLLVLMITYINLRGVKESGSIFAVPTYFFVLMMLILIGTGLWQFFTGTLATLPMPEELHSTLPSLTGFALVFLLLRAFSSGTTALTGVEAISNGIQAFQEPKSHNAASTLVWDAALLMVMFLGLGFLGFLVGAFPSEDEVLIAQVARAIYGTGMMRAVTLFSATVILIMAANTSFADFPRLAALQAGDRFLPRQFAFRSSRLVFNWGIIILAAFASLLIWIFEGSVSRLIPLYAIGVFVCFTLSQFGMAKHWWRTGKEMQKGTLTIENSIPTMGSFLRHDKRWRAKMTLNAVGAVITACVAVIFLVTKFWGGAWVITILIPLIVWMLVSIHRHYAYVREKLRLSPDDCDTVVQHHPIETVVLVGDVHKESVRIVNFVASMGITSWIPVFVDINPEDSKIIQDKWQQHFGKLDKPLVVLPSPYRSLLRPLRDYILQLRKENPDGYIHVIMGQLLTSPRTQFLHQQTTFITRLALLGIPHIVFTIVPFSVDVEEMIQQEEK